MEEIIAEIQEMLIECEMPGRRKPEFRARYGAASGHAPDEAYMQTQENKFGIEYRIYFNANDEVVEGLGNEGFNVSTSERGYLDQYRCRINSEELFWVLISQGRHLGVN